LTLAAHTADSPFIRRGRRKPRDFDSDLERFSKIAIFLNMGSIFLWTASINDGLE
jgi:hypothetical protein